jgi:hypothetical protein
MEILEWLATGDNFKSYIAPLFSPFMVIIGWRVISRDNDRRETRKETRALINDFVKKVDELQKDANRYFCFSDRGTADELEVQLKRALERLELMLGYMHRIDNAFDAQPQLTALSELITGHPNFESTNKTSVPMTDGLHLRLALTCSNLIKEVEHQFIDAQVKKRNWLTACWDDAK